MFIKNLECFQNLNNEIKNKNLLIVSGLPLSGKSTGIRYFVMGSTISIQNYFEIRNQEDLDISKNFNKIYLPIPYDFSSFSNENFINYKNKVIELLKSNKKL